MRERNAIKIFAILFAIVCLYQLSFTWVVNNIEDDAVQESIYKRNEEAKIIERDRLLLSEGLEKDTTQAYFDSLTNELEKDKYTNTDVYLDKFQQDVERSYLESKSSEKVFGPYTLLQCQKRQLNLGLDLKGGMNVTLEVMVVDVLKALANNSTDINFNKALKNASKRQTDGSDDYLTLFADEYENLSKDEGLAIIYYAQLKNKGLSLDDSNEEVIEILRKEIDGSIDRTFNTLRTRIDRFGVTQPNIQRLEAGRILIELPGIKDTERAKKLLQAAAKLEFWETYSYADLYPYLIESNSLNIEGVESVLTLLPQKINRNQNGQQIPALEFEVKVEDTSKINKLIKNTDFLKVFKNAGLDVVFAYNFEDNGQENNPTIDLVALKRNNDVRGSIQNPSGYAKVTSPMKGDVVTDAVEEIDGQSAGVSMQMDSRGAGQWRTFTKANIGKPVAIVLDGVAYSWPNVNSEIEAGRSSITGDFSLEQAEDLANILKTGEIAAPAKIINEAIVGPSLGAEAVSSGMSSFIYALIIVLIYIAFYYGKAGLASNVALLVNIFFIFGVLASLGAVLTLPGIAGIILTIGMSIDANVLIYERVREEMKNGKGIKLAIKDGYQSAYSSIIDANVTTLLTGIILYTFGTGPIKGFATTLIIGILTSLFAAIFITRLIIQSRLDKGKSISFSTKLTDGAFKNINIDFLGKRKRFYALSLIILGMGISSLFTKGLHLGVDFSGGRTYVVRFDKPVDNEEVRSSLSKLFVDEEGLSYAPEVKTFGNTNQIKITTSYLIDNNDKEVDNIINQKLYEGCKFLLSESFFKEDQIASIEKEIEELIKDDKQEKNEEIQALENEKEKILLEKFKKQYIQSSEKVGPTIADDIKQSAVWAVVFSLIVIFVYILIRFRKWQFSLGAVLAAFHDVIIVLSLFSIFYGLLPFSLEIDQAFIAAILTIIGYSLNDTVVVFDRVREYLNNNKKKQVKDIMNGALNSTLSRTINTSLTTFFVLLIIFIFGGEVIQGFMFALMVGVLVGTYSSLFIASPIMLDTIKKESTNK